MEKFHFSRHHKKILQAIIEALIYNSDVTISSYFFDQIIERVERCSSSMPQITQMGLSIILIFVEYAGIFSREFSRFSRMPLSVRIQFINVMDKSSFRVKRDISRILKGLCHTAYLNLPPLWEYIDYRPREHLENSIELRSRMISKEQMQRERERDYLMTREKVYNNQTLLRKEDVTGLYNAAYRSNRSMPGAKNRIPEAVK